MASAVVLDSCTSELHAIHMHFPKFVDSPCVVGLICLREHASLDDRLHRDDDVQTWGHPFENRTRNMYFDWLAVKTTGGKCAQHPRKDYPQWASFEVPLLANLVLPNQEEVKAVTKAEVYQSRHMALKKPRITV